MSLCAFSFNDDIYMRLKFKEWNRPPLKLKLCTTRMERNMLSYVLLPLSILYGNLLMSTLHSDYGKMISFNKVRILRCFNFNFPSFIIFPLLTWSYNNICIALLSSDISFRNEKSSWIYRHWRRWNINFKSFRYSLKMRWEFMVILKYKIK